MEMFLQTRDFAAVLVVGGWTGTLLGAFLLAQTVVYFADKRAA